MISHCSKLSSQHSLTTFKLLFFFSFHLIVLLAFPLIQLPASTFIHSSSKSVFHPHFISSPLFHVSSFTFPIYLVHPQVFFLLLTCGYPLFPLSFSYFLSSFFGTPFTSTLLCFYVFLYLQVYHFFPPLYSVPPFFLTSLPVDSLLSCFFFTSVFQAHCSQFSLKQ